MWRMIIADDEEIECRGLEMMIQNNFRNIEILPSIYNGVELLKSAQHFHPDLMIVDINMPGLNGLEAIEMLRMKAFRTKVIINTAYSNFEYIKKALQLGAVDYLVKPVSEQQLVEAVSQVIKTLEQERRSYQENKVSEKRFRDMHKIVGDELMSSILLGKPNEEGFRIWFDNLGRTYLGGVMVALQVADQGKQNVYLEMIQKLADEELKRFCTFLSTIYKEVLYLFLLPGGQVGEDNYHSWVRNLIEHLNKKIAINVSNEIYCGVSCWKYDFEKMAEALKECRSALHNNSDDNIRFFAEEGYSRIQKRNDQTEIEELAEYVKDEEWECVKLLLEQKISEWEKEKAGLWKESQLMADFLQRCGQLIWSGSRRNVSWRQILTRLKVAGGNQLLELSMNVLREMSSGPEKDGKFNSYVEEAVLYIEQNYMKDISLDRVAEHLGISSFYLSRLLTQQLDESFIELLTDIRIDHAIELIRNEDFLVKDISNRVGYLSETYFYKVFKKNTGMTVGEMRQLLKKG